MKKKAFTVFFLGAGWGVLAWTVPPLVWSFVLFLVVALIAETWE